MRIGRGCQVRVEWSLLQCGQRDPCRGRGEILMYSFSGTDQVKLLGLTQVLSHEAIVTVGREFKIELK